MSNQSSPLCYTVQELYQDNILGLGKSKLYELCRSKDFPHIRVGRKVLIPKAGLEKWLEEASQSGRLL